MKRLLGLFAALWVSPVLAAGVAPFPPPFPIPGVIYETTVTTAGTASATEQTLGTFALPPSTLAVTGQRLEIMAVFGKAANSNSVTGHLYFGSEEISTAAITTSGAGMILHLNVVKKDPNAQIVTGWGQDGTILTTPYYAATATETDTAAITIKATCTQGSATAGDCILEDFYIKQVQ